MPCEGFAGVFERAGAGKGPSRYHVRVNLPGGKAAYVGSYATTGEAALAYDNVVRCFTSNMPEGFRYAPALNYPGVTDVPPTSKRALELLPKFTAAVNARLAKQPEIARNRTKAGRRPFRPLRAFHLLTLRDFLNLCIANSAAISANVPGFRDGLFSFNDSLRQLLKDNRTELNAPTPPNPERERFEAALAAAEAEQRIAVGLADLQASCPFKQYEMNSDRVTPDTRDKAVEHTVRPDAIAPIGDCKNAGDEIVETAVAEFKDVNDPNIEAPHGMAAHPVTIEPGELT